MASRGLSIATSIAISCALLAVGVLSVASLVYGAGFLESSLPGGLPMGNAVAAVGLISVASAAVVLSTSGTAVAIASWIALCAAMARLPVSIVLAGNLALNFTSDRGEYWLFFSLGVAALGLFTLLWAVVARIRSFYRRQAAAE